MKVTRFNIATELRKMAAGKPTKADPRSVAIAALHSLQQPVAANGDSFSWLENLHKLEDPRV
jgi:hypothetical protein